MGSRNAPIIIYISFHFKQMSREKAKTELGRPYQTATIVDFLSQIFPNMSKPDLKAYLKQPTIQLSKVILTGVCIDEISCKSFILLFLGVKLGYWELYSGTTTSVPTQWRI